jgi:flagellar biosynthetic protein FliQ
MQADFFIDLLGQMFKLALQLAMPLLLATLIVGVLISVLQVVTQIQEVTLTFVPKIVVLMVVLAFVGPWMLEVLMDFSRQTISSIKEL